MTFGIKKRWFKKKYIFFTLIFIIGIRMVLPFIVVNYINRLLSDLDGYTGKIEDVDLYLYKGAYRICDIQIDKNSEETKEPFLLIPRSDLSIEWAAIFKGAIVGEVKMIDPILNFAFGPTEAEMQTGQDVDWVQIVQDLLPISINTFEIENAKLSLTHITTQPAIDATFNNINGTILNIRNVDNKEDPLPSPIKLTGSTSYSGNISIIAKANLLKEFPDLNYDLKAEGLDATKFNALTKEVAGLTVEKGELNVYSEMLIEDKKLKGYLKPLIYDLQFFTWKEKDRTFGEAIKEIFTEVAQELVENRQSEEELTATKIPLTGAIEKVESGVWATLVNTLVNAYVRTFQKVIDGDIDWNEHIE